MSRKNWHRNRWKLTVDCYPLTVFNSSPVLMEMGIGERITVNYLRDSISFFISFAL